MPIHTIKLIARREIAKNTWLFKFEKPAGFQFKSGQYAGFTLINPSETDEKGITRRFSLLSTPEDEHIAIAMRIQASAFKRVLKTQPLGSEIKFAGPSGLFTLPEDTKVPLVFIAGGIGITPFYSMICDALKHRPEQKIFLFYGNQSCADSAFLTELQEQARLYTQLKVIVTLATPEIHENWQGEIGFITEEMIRKYVGDLTTPIFYICGSPLMVNALHRVVQEMDIPPERIKIEDFPGY